MIKVIVTGAAGKMGQTIIRLVSSDKDLELVGAIESSESSNLSKDAGEMAGIGKLGVPITDNIDAIISSSDVVIDFSSPLATLNLIYSASNAKKPLIIGTTGQGKEVWNAFLGISRDFPLLVSPNMSIGVNLFWKMTEVASKTLDKSFKIDIEETHHIHKKDAPSGTAKKILDIVTEYANYCIDSDVSYLFNGKCETDSCEKPIKINAIREGEVVGTHKLAFENESEKIELIHTAHSREIFANGALKAAKWIVDKPAGLYDMQDVLFK